MIHRFNCVDLCNRFYEQVSFCLYLFFAFILKNFNKLSSRINTLEMQTKTRDGKNIECLGRKRVEIGRI